MKLVLALLIPLLALGGVSAAQADSSTKLTPVRPRRDLVPLRAEDQQALIQADQAGTLQTLPYWTGQFTIKGVGYSYTLLGSPPAAGGVTHIKTVIVPIRLTVALSDGGSMLFDGTSIVPGVLNNPIFHKSRYKKEGDRQFGDAMLHAEFPQAAAGWSLVFDPVVAPPMDIVAPVGSAIIQHSESGNDLAIVRDVILDKPIAKAVASGDYSPDQFVVFVSYNALEIAAFGYHGAVFLKQKQVEQVYSYNSWLVGVDDLFTIPSPDATTLSHEVAETIHDAFNGALASRTLLWGDAFGANKCFQDFIEVGDAVEDAPAKVQLFPQSVRTGHGKVVYTLQNEALLQWFTRTKPSNARFDAYSFPSTKALTKPAPLKCAE